MKMSGVTKSRLLPLKRIYVSLTPAVMRTILTEKALRLIKGWKGCQRIYWGVEIEDPDKLRLSVDWDSVDVHDQANKDP